MSIVIDPLYPGTIYIGVTDPLSDGYGIFKSTNGGATWKSINSGLTDAHICYLAINPQDHKTIYAASYWAWVDTLIYKSTNGGKTWKLANSGLPGSGYAIMSLVIDPKNPKIIYAAGSGVYKSTNGGATWKWKKDAEAYSLAINPLNTQTIYLGTWGGVHKSSDGGKNWKLVFKGVTGYEDLNEVHAIVIDPISTQTIYAGTGEGIFKSTNGGETWSGLTNLNVRSLAINPRNPKVLYTGTVGSGVYKSVNGGATWHAVNDGMLNVAVSSLAINPKSPMIVYAGTWQNGVLKTTNGGAASQNLSDDSQSGTDPEN